MVPDDSGHSLSIHSARRSRSLRGFENRCAHRSFPLRTADKGNGPILCAFHRWRYDEEGQVVDIPQCQELFGKTPQETGAALTPVQLATCGQLIFGRFRAPGDNETLEEFLGDSFPIIESFWGSPATHTLTTEVKANWRLCVQITVEEYHVPAVHPPYWGMNGYVKRDTIGYFRFGRHSAYLINPNPDEFARMAAECKAGTWRSASYRVFHIFPGLAVGHARTDREHWYVSAMRLVPVAKDRTVINHWACPSPFATAVEGPWYDRFLDRFWSSRWLRDRLVRYYTEKDPGAGYTGVCEKLQTIAGQIGPAPVLGRLEERIDWFEEAYEQAMRVPAAGAVPSAVSRSAIPPPSHAP